MPSAIRRAALVATAAIPALLAGCAPVEPRADYRRAAAYAQRATGVERLFDPGRIESDARYIDDCLQDGLSAEEAARIALLNNRELQAALYNVGLARADVVQAGLLSNPSLGIALRLPSAGGLANIDFDLAQNIADLWQIPPRRRAAEQDLEQTVLETAARAAEIAARARQAYYEAAGAERRLAIAGENVDLGRQVLELTEFRQRAGAGSELDVNLARGELLDAELDLQQARLAARSARRTLMSLLGLARSAADLVLSDDLPEPPAGALADEGLAEIAWRHRLDAQALQHAVSAARQRLELEIRRVLPHVSLGLAFEREARPRGAGRDVPADIARASIAAGRLAAPEIVPRSARDMDTDLVIGPLLSLELPVLDQNQARIARAQLLLQQRHCALAGLRVAIRQEVQEAADQALTAWELARFYRDQVVPQASRSLQLSRESYDAGKTSILSVLDAQRTLLTARDRQAEALQQAAATIPRLEQAAGLPFERLRATLQPGRPAAPQATTRPVNAVPVRSTEVRDEY